MSLVLVTGGLGYIGSHTVVQLIEAGYTPLVLDNLCNSKPLVIDRIHTITGHMPIFIKGDVRDRAALEKVFNEFKIDSVIHFAGLKSVGESVLDPLAYFENNVSGSITLFESMARASVKRLVFSSSATVYGDPESVPITETARLSVTNPYGRSKLMVEEILRDLCRSETDWRVCNLRYFNPVGAHESGLIGEDPNGIPNNLMPYISQVAVGKLNELLVYGSDYPTSDGTGVRDYIHVVDLAAGHLKALSVLNSNDGMLTVNLGTGIGYSVLEVIRAFELASRRPIPYRLVGRRSGDVAACFSDPSLAKDMLNWSAQYGIEKMCADAWHWQAMNPNGYDATSDLF